MTELEGLPVCTGSNKCANCGSTDWGAARTDDSGNVIMCDNCPEVPSDWDPVKEQQ